MKTNENIWGYIPDPTVEEGFEGVYSGTSEDFNLEEFIQEKKEAIEKYGPEEFYKYMK